MAKGRKTKKILKADSQPHKHSKYGVDYSAIINSWFGANLDVTKTDIAEKIGLTKMGFNTKINTPHFGTTYDLLELCLATGHDFISPLLNVLKNKGVEVKEVFTEKQMHDVIRQRDMLDNLLKRSNREIDMLYARVKDLEEQVKNAN